MENRERRQCAGDGVYAEPVDGIGVDGWRIEPRARGMNRDGRRHTRNKRGRTRLRQSSGGCIDRVRVYS